MTSSINQYDCSNYLNYYHQDWTKSSNEAFSIFFPLPPTVNLTPQNLEQCEITEIDRNFIHSNEWYDYLLQCANESQILTHNLRVEGNH